MNLISNLIERSERTKDDATESRKRIVQREQVYDYFEIC